MGNRIGAMLVALAVCACTSTESHAQSQPKDSTPTFSIFGGKVLDQYTSNGGSLTNLEFGGSADFRLRALPVPLRATLAFRQQDRSTLSPMKYGTLSVDAVGKPVPRIFGVQPYLLGGLGVGTRADYVAVLYQPGSDGQMVASTRYIPRYSWAFAEGGVGLELGRHLFVQTKLMVPVASQGQIIMPFSVGFRFWD
jgi:hypothetical protein